MVESVFKMTIASLEKLYGHQLDDVVYRMYWNMLGDIVESNFHQITQEIARTFIPSSQVPFPTIAHFEKAKESIFMPSIKPEIYHRKFISTTADDTMTAEEIKTWHDSLPDYCKSLSDRIN